MLSELEIMIKEVTENMDAYKINYATKLFPKFIDNITNWYIRRSRKRFWSKAWEKDNEDKEIAYAVLYKVLIETCKLLAPFCPFVTEEIYQNLISIRHCEEWGTNDEAIHTQAKYKSSAKIASQNRSQWHWSIHHQPFPIISSNFINKDLSEKIALVQQIISLWLSLRKKIWMKVRQPLSRIEVALSSKIKFDDQFETIKEELNVKEIKILKDVSEIAELQVKPNAKVLGPKFWGKVQEIIREAKAWNYKKLDNWNLLVCGEELSPSEIEIWYSGKNGKEVNSENWIVVYLDPEITEDLRLEWLARDIIRCVAEMRKEAWYEITDRIQIEISDKEVENAFWDFINQETLSEFAKISKADKEWEIEGIKIKIKK